ncbi:uncharacterized protein LOC108743169 [Agrilus planipennis]|uniref:Uncharacterized protein LOC108743169 n=1 Tax=Agrilus planipennis TaxID=224129 RepID=A0A1W4XMX5_AGRPL|nr:uncharacterized protein LOC108743169 [Agrilus planipennis]
MSNTIPPLLNSSPPPIVGPLDDFDNDEFGDFNSARDSSYDFDVLSFPYNTPQISHIVDHVSNGISSQNKDTLKCSLNEEHQRSDLQSDIGTKKQVLNEEEVLVQNHSQSKDEPTVDAKNSFKFEKINSTLENNISSSTVFINTECEDLIKNNTNIEETQTVDINEKEPNHDRIVNQISQLESEINENGSEKNNCISDSCKFKEENCDVQLRNETLESTNLSVSINNSSQEDKYALNFQGVERIESPYIENEGSCNSNEIIIKSVASDKERQKVEIVTNSHAKTSDGIEHKEIENYDRFENCDEEKENTFDDFADFNDHITTKTSSDVLKEEQDKQDDDFDDFADFSSASNLSATTDPEVETPTFTFPKLEEIELIIKEFFPLEQQQEVVGYFSECNEKDDVILAQIRDVTDTKALVYKWAKSNSQSALFKALNIDMRNILYGPRWNETMPPFAATLGFVPLEPVKSDSTVPPTSQESSINIPPNVPTDQIAEKEIEDVPSAQFDWNLAGLTNPLDSQSSNSLKGLKLSNEKNENIAIGDIALSKINDDTSVKSLNFNEINADYDSLAQINKSTPHLGEDDFGEFEGFTSDQYSVKEIPLRETYISNQIPISLENAKNSPVQTDNDLEFSCWVEVKKSESLSNAHPEGPQDTIDDFDDFQASSPPKQETKSVPFLHQFHASQNNEFHPTRNIVPPRSSTLPLETLIPTQVNSNYNSLTPLQPIPACSNIQVPPKIEWPEPGISGQDLDDIELSYKPKHFEEKEQDNENRPKQSAVIGTSIKEKEAATEEDDDWSDFISSENASNNSETTKTSPMFGLPDKPKAELQLSISQLNQIQPPKKPTPVITHQGLYMSGGYQSPSSIAMQMTPIPIQSRPLRQTFPNPRPTNTDFQPSLISNQYAKQVETLTFGHHYNMHSGIGLRQQTFAPITPTTALNVDGSVNDDEEWSDFVSSRPVAPPDPLPSSNGWGIRDIRAPNWPATNITPNIITNPVAFDSFHNYPTAGTKSKDEGNGKIGGVNATPFVSAVTTSVPELDFVVPKSRTWKK